RRPHEGPPRGHRPPARGRRPLADPGRHHVIRISHTSIHVDDQARAHRFYTEVLGFETKHDIDMGGPRWLTLVSPGAPAGPELVLEPDDHPAAKAYKEALVADGIPVTMFTVDDVTAEHQRLADLGVRFT